MAPGKVSPDDKQGRRAVKRAGGLGSIGCIPLLLFARQDRLPPLSPPFARPGQYTIHHNIGLFVAAFTSITHSTSLPPSAPTAAFVLFVLYDVTQGG